DPAERRARHLRQLEELAELGMEMARAVAEAALHPPPAADPAAPAAPAHTPKRTDPGLVFARLAHSVRQTIALEARIAAGTETRTFGRPPPPPDPRRALLREALHGAAEPRSGPRSGPGRADASGFRREIDERIDDELAADPAGDIAIEDLLVIIARDLGVTLDYSRLSDAVIGMTDAEPEPEPEPDPEPDPAAPAPPPGPAPHGPDPP
ncbi:MAG TPA: hypothetical protein VHY76_15790, partial [Acetobacteraceae bacterium]|nr:hypothetical protein [Acetobacteraceae bacterium]